MKKMDQTEWSSTRKSGWSILLPKPPISFQGTQSWKTFPSQSPNNMQITKLRWNDHQKNVRSQQIELIHSNQSFLEPKHPKMTPAPLIWAAQPTLNTSVVSEHQNLSWFIRKAVIFHMDSLRVHDFLVKNWHTYLNIIPSPNKKTHTQKKKAKPKNPNPSHHLVT